MSVDPSEDHIRSISAQELKRNTYNLTRMNLVMRAFCQAIFLPVTVIRWKKTGLSFEENDPVNTYNPSLCWCCGLQPSLFSGMEPGG